MEEITKVERRGGMRETSKRRGADGPGRKMDGTERAIKKLWQKKKKDEGGDRRRMSGSRQRS